MRAVLQKGGRVLLFVCVAYWFFYVLTVWVLLLVELVPLLWSCALTALRHVLFDPAQLAVKVASGLTLALCVFKFTKRR